MSTGRAIAGSLRMTGVLEPEHLRPVYRTLDYRAVFNDKLGGVIGDSRRSPPTMLRMTGVLERLRDDPELDTGGETVRP